jgi:uncharacterized membrane-anchored protein YitT (DUF2179 family)
VLVITILRTTGSYGGEPIKNLVLLTEYANVLETKGCISFITKDCLYKILCQDGLEGRIFLQCEI